MRTLRIKAPSACLQHRPPTRKLIIRAYLSENPPRSQSRSTSPADVVPSGLTSALDLAQKDLGAFCSTRPDADSMHECWEVYEDFDRKRHDAETACEVELNSEGRLTPTGGCKEFENLAQLAWELEYSGAGVENMYRVLQTSYKLQHRPPSSEGRAVHSPELERLERMQQAASVAFDTADTNGDGYLDRDEFVAAMEQMDDILDAEDIGQVFQALDVHGRISREQFMDAAIAEGLLLESVDKDSDLMFLRHLHASRPAWWTATPGMIDNA